MKSFLIALVTLNFLTACSTTVFDSRGVPDVKPYSASEQKAVGKELQDAKCDPRLNKPQECQIPTIKEWLKDYKVMRDQARAATDN